MIEKSRTPCNNTGRENKALKALYECSLGSIADAVRFFLVLGGSFYGALELQCERTYGARTTNYRQSKFSFLRVLMGSVLYYYHQREYDTAVYYSGKQENKSQTS